MSMYNRPAIYITSFFADPGAGASTQRNVVLAPGVGFRYRVIYWGLWLFDAVAGAATMQGWLNIPDNGASIPFGIMLTDKRPTHEIHIPAPGIPYPVNTPLSIFTRGSGAGQQVVSAHGYYLDEV